MTQNQINREVAKATGETVECVRRLGFNLVIVPHYRRQPRHGGSCAKARQSKPSNVKIHQPKAA